MVCRCVDWELRVKCKEIGGVTVSTRKSTYSREALVKKSFFFRSRDLKQTMFTGHCNEKEREVGLAVLAKFLMFKLEIRVAKT